MSTLLEQASLVMIPSGYKEDVVYSQIPTSGAGDLSFTRASNGTRINSAGLVEVCPWNMLEYSEQFDNAIWAKDAGNTITANSTTAPNGTTTADTLSASAGSVVNVSQLITTTAGVYTYSIYLKKNATNLMSTYIYLIGTGFVASGEVNFDNGTYTTSSGTGAIENLGNGWFRISLTQTLGAGVNSFGIINFSTTGTRSVYIWGAQLNIGSTAKPYFPTTDRLNVPRLTYQNGGGGCPSLLLEKQSTNLLPYSEDFSQWFSAGGTVTTNTATSPDGTQNADTLTGARYHVGVGTGIFTFSCYAKKIDGDNTFQLRLDVPATISAVFNLNTGAIVSTPSGYSATIEPAGNGWYRCTLTSNSSITITNAVVISANTSSNSTYVWGGQCEASSYPTSYIPTTSSSATRVADACFKTGISSLIGQTEGTMFFELQRDNTDNDTRLQISDGSGANWLFVSIETGLNPRVYCNVGGVNQFSAYGSAVSNSTHKVALAYKSNDFKVYIDGVAVITQTSGSVPACSRLDVGSASPSGPVVSTSLIKDVILFPTRLSNSELASLTTI